MYLKDAMNEYAFDCRIRKLSPRTLDNYTKQLRYFEEYLLENYGIDHIEEVKRMHIKHFMGMMDAKNRKPQYINDLLKVIKTFFRYGLVDKSHLFCCNPIHQKKKTPPGVIQYT